MTQEKWLDAVTDLDPDILDRYFTVKSTLAKKKKTANKRWVRWGAVAASFVLAIAVCIVGSLIIDMVRILENDIPPVIDGSPLPDGSFVIQGASPGESVIQLFDAQRATHRLFILLPVLFISLIALSLSFIKREVTRKQLIMIYAISIATINILEVLGLYLCSQAAYLPHVLIISNIGILLFLAAFTLLTRKTKVFWVKLLLCLIVFGMLGASVLGASWIARNALGSGVFGITVEKPDINDIDPDRLLQIKQAYLDMKTETMGHHDMTTDDVLVVKYCGTYNECVVMMFTDSQSFYTTAIRSASVAGVQFTYSDSNQLYAWKSGEMYTLEQAYEAKILRRSDIRDIRNIHAQIPADFSGIGTEIPKIDDAVTGFNLNKIGLANVGGCRVGAIESEEELYAALNDLIAKWKYLMITIGSENHIEPDELENMNYRDIYHDKYPTRTVVLVMRNNLNMEALKDLSLREDVSFIWISEKLVAVPDED